MKIHVFNGEFFILAMVKMFVFDREISFRLCNAYCFQNLVDLVLPVKYIPTSDLRVQFLQRASFNKSINRVLFFL